MDPEEKIVTKIEYIEHGKEMGLIQEAQNPRIKLLQTIPTAVTTGPRHNMYIGDMASRKSGNTEHRRIQTNKTKDKKWDQRRNSNVC